MRETADVPPGNDKPERENPGNESPNGKPNGKPSHPDRTAKESEKNGTQGLPKTGEFNNPLLALAGGILLIGVVVYVMKQRKNKWNFSFYDVKQLTEESKNRRK